MQYLSKHSNGTYYLRIRVPKDLQLSLKRSEVLRSLHTSCKNIAKRRCYALATRLLICFDKAKGRDMSWKEIKDELTSTFQRIVREEIDYINTNGPKSDERLEFLTILGNDFDDLSDIARSTGDVNDFLPYVEAANNNNYIHKRLQRELHRLSRSDFDSMTYAEVMSMLSSFYKEAVKLHLDARKYGVESPEYKIASKAVGSSLQLTKAFTKYKIEKQKAHSWTEKTAKEIDAPFNDLIEVFGDIEINQLTRTDAIKFKDIISNLPRNLTQIKANQFPNQSLYKISQQSHERTVSPKTINKKLGFLCSFFDWCANNNHCDNNIFNNVKTIAPKKKARDERDGFTQAEMQDIIDNAIRENNEWKKWVTLIGAYSGLRLNEICQLYQENIIERDDMWCFDVTDSKEGQRLKNLNSRRLVPIHKSILVSGFLAFIDQNSEGRLFPEFKLSVNGYGDKASKWFNRTFLTKLTLKTDKKSFHSLRHTFITALQRNVTEEAIAQAIAGHAAQSITFNRYGGDYNLATLKTAIDGVEYHQTDELAANSLGNTSR